QAMAWSVFYAPHAVVIDGEAEWLDDALNELLSVTGPSARGRDVIVRVGGAPFALNVPEFIDFVRLPLDVSGEALAHAISAAVQGARLPKVLA
ncbi:MAG: hypothetical protein MUC99_05870, partial [Anaerolineae bacterium]|nr:hypothetical protein [Anaerolineae bacterium]